MLRLAFLRLGLCTRSVHSLQIAKTTVLGHNHFSDCFRMASFVLKIEPRVYWSPLTDVSSFNFLMCLPAPPSGEICPCRPRVGLEQKEWLPSLLELNMAAEFEHM